MSSKQEILQSISEDMESDIKEFDGKPFTGLTVGTQFGNQGAALAGIVSALVDRIEELESHHA